MRSCMLFVALLVLPGSVIAGEEAPLFSPEFEVEDVRARSSFYCQVPDYVGVYNVSSGFGSEIADDIPNEFAGATVSEVTLWVGEWSAPWQDPTGVAVNFYDAQCPPAMEPMLSFMIPWNQWNTQLVYSGYAEVYRAEATLPEPVVLEAGMSIGAYVVITWGQNEPFAGLCSTGEWDINGCGEAYLDASWWGYARWSPTSLYTQIPRDFAYCLGGATSVDDEDIVTDGLQLRSCPNPLDARATISFTLARPGDVRLAVYDVAGREVAVLADGPRSAGDHEALWDRSCSDGVRAGAGVYFARLVTADMTQTLKLVVGK